MSRFIYYYTECRHVECHCDDCHGSQSVIVKLPKRNQLYKSYICDGFPVDTNQVNRINLIRMNRKTITNL
jgi:hypothetical protein